MLFLYILSYILLIYVIIYTHTYVCVWCVYDTQDKETSWDYELRHPGESYEEQSQKFYTLGENL